MVRYSKIKIVSEVGVRRLHIQGVVEANQTACNGLPTYQVKKEIKKKN
jgi:hypothetical protein